MATVNGTQYRSWSVKRRKRSGNSARGLTRKQPLGHRQGDGPPNRLSRTFAGPEGSACCPCCAHSWSRNSAA